MVDTVRTESDLLTNVFQDGQADGSIRASDMRDLVVSTKYLTGQGWDFHLDGTYTVGSPRTILAGTKTQVTIDGSSEDIGHPILTHSEDHFWDILNNKITLNRVNDFAIIRFTFTAQSTLSETNRIELELDAGGISGIIYQDTLVFAKGSGNPQSFNVVMPIFAGVDLIVNGGILYLTPDADATFWDFSITSMKVYAQMPAPPPSPSVTPTSTTTPTPTVTASVTPTQTVTPTNTTTPTVTPTNTITPTTTVTPTHTGTPAVTPTQTVTPTPSGAAIDTDMILVFATTAPTQAITLVAQNNGVFNADIDWGDTTVTNVTTYNGAGMSHTYASAGEHTVRISGAFPNLYLYGSAAGDKLVEVGGLGDTGLVTLSETFRDCQGAITFAGYGNLSGVTSGYYTFRYIEFTTPPDTSQWVNTGSIENMYGMFSYCYYMLSSPDTSTWDTSSVTSMEYMFYEDYALETPPDTSLWDTSSVTTTHGMFDGAVFTTAPDVSGWNTSLITDINYMFYGNSLTDIAIDGWNIGSLLSGVGFLQYNSMPTVRYDAVLINWQGQVHQPNVTIHFGTSTYTSGGAAEAARAALVSDGWIITDGGVAP